MRPCRVTASRSCSTSRPKAPGSVHHDVVEPLRDALGEFRTAIGGDPKRVFVRSFVRHIEEDLANGSPGPHIRRADVTLMTEIAWHYMTRGTSEYAGWRDLLLGMGLEAGESTEDARLPRITNLESLQEWLVEGLKKTTEISRATRTASTSRTARDDFYSTIAEIISAQAALDRESLPKKVTHKVFPPGVAFVTSFDVELEMALVDLHQPFVMVAPFEFVAGGNTPHPRGALVWLFAIVTPTVDGANDTALIQGPQRWDYLSAATFESVSSPASGLPVVVRLTGSPLVQAPQYDDLPEPAPALDHALGLTRGAQRRVVNAVLVDEHAGLHHWSADLISYQDTANRTRAFGLPTELVANRYYGHEKEVLTDKSQRTSASADADAEHGKPLATGAPSSISQALNLDCRFWLLMGVQIGDPAIRHRVASLVGTGAMRSGLAGTNEPPYAGVVVNRRSEPRERDVFHWLGLDSVTSDCLHVLDDLKHHLGHLRAPERRFANGDCPMREKEDAS